MHTEFDDTVKQIQLFHRNGSFPYQILLLGFSPNFRHFLHRQSVFRAPYWSCFDAIQEIRRRKAAVLSFHNMKWPPHMEFIYTPFAVVALREGERFAQIEFGEDGNPIQIDMYEKGELCRRNLYDDRGFVSSTILYRGGKGSEAGLPYGKRSLEAAPVSGGRACGGESQISQVSAFLSGL